MNIKPQGLLGSKNNQNSNSKPQCILKYTEVLTSTNSNQKYTKVPKTTQKYKKYSKVLRSTQKYSEVPKSTQKYSKVSKSTKNNPKVPKSTPKYSKVHKGTQKYPGSANKLILIYCDSNLPPVSVGGARIAFAELQLAGRGRCSNRRRRRMRRRRRRRWRRRSRGRRSRRSGCVTQRFEARA